jgi:hypothetical protein
MDRDLLGTTRVGVVRDDFDRHQDRMHLDCVFSILGEGCCLMLDTIMGQASPTRRLVDEYVRDPATGRYVLVRSGVELSEFIRCVSVWCGQGACSVSPAVAARASLGDWTPLPTFSPPLFWCRPPLANTPSLPHTQG